MGSGASHNESGSCSLAGTWLPTRSTDWKNRNFGIPHSTRAQMPKTKMVYDKQGRGSGQVGELRVTTKVRTLAPGQFSGSAKTFMGLWSANDGNWTILPDGVLEIRFPSNGITEYWYREDGQALVILQRDKAAHQQAKATQGVALFREASHDYDASIPVVTAIRTCEVSQSMQRSPTCRQLMVFFRKVDLLGIAWHWALGIGEMPKPSIYEVGGLMAVLGPTGIVAVSFISPKNAVSRSGTKVNQFQGVVLLKGATTTKTDSEIETFAKVWVRDHPVYNPLGPNCQTFTEDLHIFCTGKNLNFSKVGDLKSGPERSSDVIWL